MACQRGNDGFQASELGLPQVSPTVEAVRGDAIAQQRRYLKLGALLTVSYWLELSSFERARTQTCTLKHPHLDHQCL